MVAAVPLFKTPYDIVLAHCIVLLSVVFYFNVFFLFAVNFVIFSLRATILLNLNLNLQTTDMIDMTSLVCSHVAELEWEATSSSLMS